MDISEATIDGKRKISVPLIIGIIFMPYIFSWFTFRSGYSLVSRLIASIYLIIFIIVLNLDGLNQPLADTQKNAIYQAPKVLELTKPEDIERLAIEGVADAQFKFGKMYADGLDFEKNDLIASEWYRKAADQGHAEAQYYLSEMYLEGEGVEHSVEESIKLLRDASNQGFSQAQYKLGMFHMSGIVDTKIRGVEQDLVKGVNLIEKSANQGNSDAQFQLGLINAVDKFGLKSNYPEALKWMEKAVDSGHPEAKEVAEEIRSRMEESM